jgi:hypothetical protein
MDTTTLRFYVDYLSNIYFYYLMQTETRTADAALVRTCGLCGHVEQTDVAADYLQSHAVAWKQLELSLLCVTRLVLEMC